MKTLILSTLLAISFFAPAQTETDTIKYVAYHSANINQQGWTGADSVCHIVLVSPSQLKLYIDAQSKLISGTNIKTINGSSVLGSGNLVVSGSGAAWGEITGTLSAQSDLQTALNAKGPAIPVQYTFIGQQAWTNKNSALQEFLNTNQRRLTIDMTNATQFRIISNVTAQGASGSITGFQYSDDGGTTWRGLDNGTSGQNSTVTNSDLGTGSKVSAWTNLAAGAKADRLVRIAGSAGDGTADPAFSNISLQLK